MHRPSSIVVAVILQWLAVVVSVFLSLSLVVGGLELSSDPVVAELRAALERQGVAHIDAPLLVVSVLMSAFLVFAMATVRFIASIYLWQGRSWARIVLTVLTVLQAVSAVAYLTQGYVWRSLLTIVIDVVVLYLMFCGPSSAFIRAGTAAHRETSVA